MSDDGAVLSVMGHCQTHGKPDQYHGLCDYEYHTQFGVLRRCSCPQHQKDADALVLQGSERETGGDLWENVASPQGAQTPAGSDHRSILETNGG